MLLYRGGEAGGAGGAGGAGILNLILYVVERGLNLLLSFRTILIWYDFPPNFLSDGTLNTSDFPLNTVNEAA